MKCMCLSLFLVHELRDFGEGFCDWHFGEERWPGAGCISVYRYGRNLLVCRLVESGTKAMSVAMRKFGGQSGMSIPNIFGGEENNSRPAFTSHVWPSRETRWCDATSSQEMSTQVQHQLLPEHFV